MQNLYSQYDAIKNDPSKWKYYKKLTIPNELFSNNEDLRDFINDYFQAGGKSILLKDLNLSDDRISHTVSLFFLGIHLSDLILGNDKNDMSPDFRYLWFLTSLYHDFGYHFEGNTRLYHLEDYESIQVFIKSQNIKNTVYKTNLIPIGCKSISPKVIENYYRYCIKHRRKIDHGIVGGLLLYDRLIKNYDMTYDKKKRTEPDATKENFIHNNLLYSICQHDYFKKVSLAIINHNIWFCSEENNNCLKLYKKNKLGELIIGKNQKGKKHSWSDDKFLFLLILADTIEPIKFFRGQNPVNILESIQISLEKEIIIIRVKDNIIDHSAWFDKIKDLMTWVNIIVTQSKEKEKELQISGFWN